MININDLITIPYTPDLTEGGITYACRSLPHIYDQLSGSSFSRLRSITASIAVELAFRRYLNQQNIPFDIKSYEPFTNPDRYDVSLGGHRCDLQSFLISYRSQISALRADHSLILKAPAMVPLDQYSMDGHSSNDIYIFAFLTGLIAASPDEVNKAARAEQPVCLIHTMPNAWTRPQVWIPLGPLILKSESDQTLSLIIGGQNASRQFLTHTLELLPNTRYNLDVDFFSVAFIQVKFKPNARLGIYSPSRKETYLIESNEWSNIWIYGIDIYLTGWISRLEFRQRAVLIKEGSRVFQYGHTHEKHLAVSIADLKPLSELFDHVREWK
jgi:hypothetical protein